MAQICFLQRARLSFCISLEWGHKAPREIVKLHFHLTKTLLTNFEILLSKLPINNTETTKMPFHSLLATPPKRNRRFCELRPGNKQSKHSQKSETNLDKELLQHVKEAKLYQDVDVASRKGPREGQAPSPSLPYSKDFGTFDLTLCLATDGRCVVLVEYEQRIFVNGRQVRKSWKLVIIQ